MKKIQILILLIFVAISIKSCKKPEYCAVCVELISGHEADDYCGPPQLVDKYIRELKKTNVVGVWNWSCKKEVK